MKNKFKFEKAEILELRRKGDKNYKPIYKKHSGYIIKGTGLTYIDISVCKIGSEWFCFEVKTGLKFLAYGFASRQQAAFIAVEKAKAKPKNAILKDIARNLRPDDYTLDKSSV